MHLQYHTAQSKSSDVTGSIGAAAVAVGRHEGRPIHNHSQHMLHQNPQRAHLALRRNAPTQSPLEQEEVGGGGGGKPPPPPPRAVAIDGIFDSKMDLTFIGFRAEQVLTPSSGTNPGDPPPPPRARE